MHRAGVESILGVRVRNGNLHFDPCISPQWQGFEIVLRHGAARYRISVDNAAGVTGGIAHAILDETIVAARPLIIPLLDDGRTHLLAVRLGVEPAAQNDA
jgi:cyclic beta-1,2-glucan synthetase